MKKKNEQKMIVFDLDETLGCFTQFGMFWDTISAIFNKSFSQNIFNQILNLYPTLFRPNIFSILRYLKKKKINNPHLKIIIYTNNQGPKSWTLFIKNYIEEKINYKIFDKVICAYKFNNKQLELCRTTHNKTYPDLIRCTKLNKLYKICFIDDKMHPQMKHSNISYIHIRPYYITFPLDLMINKFLKSNIGINLKKKFFNVSNEIFKEEFMSIYKSLFGNFSFSHKINNVKSEEYTKSSIIGKKLLKHLQHFLKVTKSKTLKTKKKIKNRTRKNN